MSYKARQALRSPLTSAQIRAARSLLRWTADELAVASPLTLLPLAHGAVSRPIRARRECYRVRSTHVWLAVPNSNRTCGLRLEHDLSDGLADEIRDASPGPGGGPAQRLKALPCGGKAGFLDSSMTRYDRHEICPVIGLPSMGLGAHEAVHSTSACRCFPA